MGYMFYNESFTTLILLGITIGGYITIYRMFLNDKFQQKESVYLIAMSLSLFYDLLNLGKEPIRRYRVIGKKKKK